MDEILDYEQEHLKSVLNKINLKIMERHKNMPYKEVSLYSVTSDREDRKALMFQKERNHYTYESIRNLRKAISEPYFARLDVRINNSCSEIMYLGNKHLELDGYRIYDWRSPVGKFYYQKNILSSNVKNTRYELLLRRLLQIENSILLSYHDEYVYGDELAVNQITDPFLIEVLKSKKREYKITNIIKSIQKNQNDIITEFLSSSFVVQGCAGSGKTMIMLHRLSYLKYNNPDINIDKFIILTPSSNFNYFINDLAIELELDQIDRMTKEEYFYSCLIQYDSNKWKKVKLTNVELPDVFIRELYSDKRYHDLEVVYNKYIDNLVTSLDLPHVNDICIRYGYEKFVLNTGSDARKIDSILSFITKTEYLNNQSCTKRKKLLSQIENEKEKLRDEGRKINVEALQLETNKVSSEIDKELQRLEQQRSSLINNFIAFLYQKDMLSEDAYESTENYTDALKRIRKSLIDYNIRLEEIIHNESKKLKLVEDDITESNKYNEEIRKTSYEKIATYENQIIEIQNTLCNSFFNRVFRKKAYLNKIDELQKTITEVNSDLKSKLYLNECRLTQYENEKTQIIESINIKQSLVLNKEELHFVDECHDELWDCQYHITELRFQKNRLQNIFISETDNYNQIQIGIEKLVKEVECIEQRIIPSKDLHVFLDIRKKLLVQDISTIYNNTFGILVAQLESKYKVKNKQNCYYQAYLWLHFYSLFMGQLIYRKKYINIDEGQDLSPNEYAIIKKMNGTDSCFNIYGDVNQNIYINGMSSWNSIEFMVKLYEINENYRNTIAITTFCNDTFSFNHLPIGIEGVDVRFIGLRTAIQEISRIVNQPQIERFAIIVSDSHSDFAYECLEVGCVSGKIQEGIIPVVTVASIKGLEFDIVYVVIDGMSNNEKYIAFTRAISELIVIN